jgi:serine/threonine-protein kinase
MADVFEARHVELGKRVAVKILHAPVASNRDSVRSVVREGRALAAIHHPHVVEVLDVGEQDRTPYLVMELLEGEDLAQHLHGKGTLASDTIADLLLPVISGVMSAHTVGVIHRDLKPSNIFLAKRHHSVEPVVVDFGVSKSARGGSSATSSLAAVGTALYMAPEQVRGSRDVTPQADQYALGVIMYECATGGTPFWDEDRYELLHAIMTATVVPPSELNPAISPEFGDVVLRAMARDPDARFPSLRALGAALLPYATEEAKRKWAAEFSPTIGDSGVGMAVAGPATRPSARPDRPKRSLARLAPFVGAAALAATIVGATTLRSRSSGPAPAPPAAMDGVTKSVAVQVAPPEPPREPAIAAEAAVTRAVRSDEPTESPVPEKPLRPQGRRGAAQLQPPVSSASAKAVAPPRQEAARPAATTMERGTGNVLIVE